MSMATLKQVATATRGELHGADAPFSAVSTDTRTLQEGELFFALRGERYDASEFVAAADAAGAAGAVVEALADTAMPQIKVVDTRLALADYARAWRLRHDLPVIGITGSNGKTTVKEMLAAILRCAHAAAGPEAVLATTGNLNNEIGVPLTLLRLRAQHRVAIVEMGASRRGDIAVLAAIGLPTVSVITSIARAHLEGLGSLDGVAETKGAIVDRLGDSGVAVLPQDSAYFEALARRAGVARVVSFGATDAADIFPTQVRPQSFADVQGFTFELCTPDGSIAIELPLTGVHNVVNAAAAAAAALAAGATLADVQAGLGGATNVGGRLRSFQLASGATVFDDSYNANPDSMAAAVREMQRLGGHVVLALGDMGELGDDAAGLHRAIGELARETGAAELICTGPLSQAMAEGFGAGAHWCATPSEAEAVLRSVLQSDSKVLVKASRFMGLDQLVHALRATDSPALTTSEG